jgi:ASCH domain
MKSMRALSIRQPYAEQILRGTKKVEYRGRPTRIRERVYIYASMTPGYLEDWEAMNMQPGDLPTGVLVGTVEIKGCTGEPGAYEWHLAKPERLKRNLKPKKHPKPAWFYPF